MYNVPIIGNLAHDLELKNGKNGKKYVNFTLIRNERVKDSEEEKPVRYPMTAFDTTAENLVASARKGDRLSATVRIGNRVQEAFRLRQTDDKPTNLTQLTLTATDVAVVLNFATAAITKNPRRGANESTFAEDEASAPAQAAAPAAAAPAAAKSAPAMAGAGAPVSDDLF